MQTCIWPSWCQCHSLSLVSVKFRVVFTFMVPAHPGSPGQRAVKCVCACVCACVRACVVLCFFSTKPRDWLGQSCPKWPVLCRVGLKPYVSQSPVYILYVTVNASVVGGDVDVIHQFRMQIAMIQHAAVGWLHSVVPKLLVIKPSDFMHWYNWIARILSVSDAVNARMLSLIEEQSQADRITMYAKNCSTS